MMTDQAAPVGQAQGIRTLPGPVCTHASGPQAADSCPTIARTALPLAERQASSLESKAPPVRVLGSYHKPLLHARAFGFALLGQRDIALHPLW
jgi:hypothetical protein